MDKVRNRNPGVRSRSYRKTFESLDKSIPDSRLRRLRRDVLADPDVTFYSHVAQGEALGGGDCLWFGGDEKGAETGDEDGAAEVEIL